MTKTKTVTITTTHRIFEKGDKVTSGSRHRCPLEYGKVFTVVSYHHPYDPLISSGTVFVKGEKYGVEAQYLIGVEGEPA